MSSTAVEAIAIEARKRRSVRQYPASLVYENKSMGILSAGDRYIDGPLLIQGFSRAPPEESLTASPFVRVNSYTDASKEFA
jgi:hypothetical protein